jgi:DNA-binding protein YbaB
MEVVSLKIDPQAVDPRDVEMLQDLVIAAVNQAMLRAQQMVQEELKSVTGGLPIANLFTPPEGSDTGS